MSPRVLMLAGLLAAAVPASATDMPARKPGLWEIRTEFAGHNLPARTIRECIDAATDKVMNANFGGGAGQTCSKRDIEQSGATMTIDSVCAINGATIVSHAVVSGSFDSAYTVDVASKREGAAASGMRVYGESHIKIAAKWLGPCTGGQRPGDMIMENGMTMNILDLKKGMPPRLPPRP